MPQYAEPPLYTETLQYLKKDPVNNLNIIYFMENYQTEGIVRAGKSVLIRGTSDNKWLYISSSNKSELAFLTKQMDKSDTNFAAVQSWMLPLLTKERSVDWIMSTTQCLLPADVGLPRAELKTSPLLSQDASFIYEQLGYRDITTVEYITDRITRGESAALYERDRPVAWAATHDDGAMGLLYVLPEYRRRGYAKAVLVCLAEQIRRAGRIPFAQIEEENHRSLHLTAKLGFVPHRDVHWLKTN
ncbi:MAG: GNAT family N-acetyltransferase [Bacillota bacterium]|nr:GNAT family N-acetyltransferase [Bacillota bacterium]MDW7684198.1 GNAT family N-acetyltransferase [Bacillota bacterium]